MNPETVQRLQDINLAFYRQHATDFSRTRETAWPGWSQVERRLATEHREQRSAGQLQVLDVGCGNGRFGAFLQNAWHHQHHPFDYHGVDSSSELIHLARRRVHTKAESAVQFLVADVLGDDWHAELPQQSYSAIAVFGLLHHLPAAQNRERLLQTLSRLLETGGLLVVSFWQFGSDARFHSKRLPWEEHNERADEPIDLAELEAGDLLLTWGQANHPDTARRYCHFTEPHQADELVSRLPVELVDRFFADGHGGALNLYFILRR